MNEGVDPQMLAPPAPSERAERLCIRPGKTTGAPQAEMTGGKSRVAPRQEKPLRRKGVKGMKRCADGKPTGRVGPSPQSASHADRLPLPLGLERPGIQSEGGREAGKALHDVGDFPTHASLRGPQNRHDGAVRGGGEKSGRPAVEKGFDGRSGFDTSCPAGHDPSRVTDFVGGLERPAQSGKISPGPLGGDEEIGLEDLFSLAPRETEVERDGSLVGGEKPGSQTECDAWMFPDGAPKGTDEGVVTERPTERLEAVRGRVEEERRAETRGADDNSADGGDAVGDRRPKSVGDEKTPRPLGENDSAGVARARTIPVRLCFENDDP